MSQLNLTESRDFVFQQARLNIERVNANPGYLEQAKQVNASLQSLVAMERNVVMAEAVRIAQNKIDLRNVIEA